LPPFSTFLASVCRYRAYKHATRIESREGIPHVHRHQVETIRDPTLANLRCLRLGVMESWPPLPASIALDKRFPEPATTRTSPPTRDSLSIEGGFLEAWAQGYNVGSLVILILIVFCNYRSGIWLHKLILLEVSKIIH
jgi:hypothetical protein